MQNQNIFRFKSNHIALRRGDTSYVFNVLYIFSPAIKYIFWVTLIPFDFPRRTLDIRWDWDLPHVVWSIISKASFTWLEDQLE